MNVQEAQAALQVIRRQQDRTRDELVRHLFALPYMVLMAVGLFIGYASADLQGPGGDLVLVLGFGLFVGALIAQHLRMCRASVRPRFAWLPDRRDLPFYLVWAAGPPLLFLACERTAAIFDLPAKGTLAAAVTALAYVAATPLFREVTKSIMKRQDGRN